MKSWILKRESHKCGNDLCRKKHQQKNFEELFLNVQMKVLIQKFSLPGLYILSAIPLLITLSLYFYPDTSARETQFVIWGGGGPGCF